MADQLTIQINGDIQDYQKSLKTITKDTKKLQGVLTDIAKPAAIAFAALTTIVGLTNKTFIDYEKALVGVGKTTDIEGKALEKFGKNIQDLSKRIPVAANELLGIAQAAGQLGVRGEENLLKFTETVAKLGVSTDLAGEEAATALTRILTVTGEGVEDIDKFGSAVVALGNNFAATESEIVRMATEVSRSTAVFGVSAGESAALGAALKSVGVQAQLGGSAIGRAFRAIDKAVRQGGEEMKHLEELTGQTGATLTKTFKEDSVAAFQLFIKGLGDVAARGGDTTEALGKFGLKGEEILKVLPVLALKSELVGKALKTAAKESKNATALNKEAAKAFATLGSNIQTLKNSIVALSVDMGSLFAKDITNLVEGAKSLAKGLSELDDETKENLASFIKWAAIISGSIATIALVGKGILVVSGLLGSLGAAFLTAGGLAATFWTAVTGPIGIAIAGIALVTAGIGALWAILKEEGASEELEKNNSKLKSLKRTQGQLNQFIKDSKGVNSETAIERLAQIDAEIKKLEDLKNKKIEVGEVSTEGEEDKKDEEDGGVDQKAIDKAVATAERLKNQKQTEFEDKKAQLLENQELLTEEELEAAQEAFELKEEQKAEQELIAQARELESKGKHDEALALLEDARVQKQIKDSDKILKVKKDDDKKDLDNKKKLAALEKDLAIKTSDAKVTLVKNTANLVQTILGKESKAAFIIGKIVAAGDVLLADSKSRAWAAAASLSAASAAGPAAPAVFAASMASYNALLTANTAIALGTIAAQTVTGFADGGRAIGGIPGVDSIPAMLQNNEFVSPAQNFEEVIGSVRAKREAEDLTGEGGFGGGQQVDIRVSYDSPEASQIVTVSQVEDTALGISRDSFKESA